MNSCYPIMILIVSILRTDMTHGTCSDGYHQQNGDISGWGTINGRGGGEGVSNCQSCADLCSAETECNSYECSNTQLRCNLNQAANPTKSASQDYAFCTKCSNGYYPQTGDIGGWGTINGRGGGEAVANCGACAYLCGLETECKSYECSNTELKCNLNEAADPSSGANRDYFFCTKQAHSIVTINPDSTNTDISVALAADTRSITANGFENNGIYDNKWRINAKYDGVSLRDWPLTMKLSANSYGFRSGEISSIKITMEASCLSAQCDAFWAFSINDEKYATFINDFDGSWKRKASSPSSKGIYIYPSCGTSNSLISGDASSIISAATQGFRAAIAGGNNDNWYRLSSSTNGNTFPVSFEFINDGVADTFSIQFISSKFSSGLKCIYGSAVQSLADFKLYVTPDDDNELGLLISSFQIEAVNTGDPAAPQPTTPAPTTPAPTTKAPTTKNPTTKAPTTKAPTTKAPTTQAPSKYPSSAPSRNPSTAPTKAPSTQRPTRAPSPHPYDRYEVGPDLVNFSNAQAYCNSFSKTLAIIRNAEDNDAVQRLCDYADTSKSNGCWIGLYKENNVWRWQDNSNDYMLEYMNVELPVVVGFNNECVGIPESDDMNLKWQSYSCNDMKYPICDHPTLNPTQSPTLSPTQPTKQPTQSPTLQPTKSPTSCTVVSYCGALNKGCNEGGEQVGICHYHEESCNCRDTFGCSGCSCDTCSYTSRNCTKTVCTSGMNQVQSPQQPQKPKQYNEPYNYNPNNISISLSSSSSWIIAICSFLGVILCINIIFMYTINCCKKRSGKRTLSFKKIKGYQDFDESEANPFNV